MFCKHIHDVENNAHMYCNKWVHDRPLLVDIPNNPYYAQIQATESHKVIAVCLHINEMLTATSLVAPLYYGQGSLCMEVAYLGKKCYVTTAVDKFLYSIFMLIICAKFHILDSL